MINYCLQHSSSHEESSQWKLTQSVEKKNIEGHMHNKFKKPHSINLAYTKFEIKVDI